KSGEHMVGILPNALRYNERSAAWNCLEYFNAHALGIDESVLLLRIVCMRAYDFPAQLGQGVAKHRFHFSLGLPAKLVGGQTQVATGDKPYFLLFHDACLPLVYRWSCAEHTPRGAAPLQRCTPSRAFFWHLLSSYCRILSFAWWPDFFYIH